MADVDNSPCGKLERLYTIRFALAEQAGKAVKVIEVEGTNGTRRRVDYHAADVKLLNEEIRRLEPECARSKGQRYGRSAISFG